MSDADKALGESAAGQREDFVHARVRKVWGAAVARVVAERTPVRTA